MINTSSKI